MICKKKFAEKHNVTLIDGGKTESETKMEIANKVMKHYDEVYLIFFKAYKQEAYLMDAVNQKNINSIEQNISSLQNFAEQGLEKLKDLRGYNNDASLIVACRNLLNFYKDEAKKGIVFYRLFPERGKLCQTKKAV